MSAKTGKESDMSCHDFGPNSGGRVKGLVVVKPIVFGNIARYFGKKREEDGHTHQWTVYLKPYANEDMSAYVKKVHFKLHESYTNTNRIFTKMPYEITETGWGEFEIVIKIYFLDPNERPITLYHILKLFQSPLTVGGPPQVGRTLVSETYDEIVFHEPTQLMQHLLNSVKPITSGPWIHNTNCRVDGAYVFHARLKEMSANRKGSERADACQGCGLFERDTAALEHKGRRRNMVEEKKEKTLQKIVTAQPKIRSEINELKERLQLAKETVAKFKEEIAKAQNSGGSLSSILSSL